MGTLASERRGRSLPCPPPVRLNLTQAPCRLVHSAASPYARCSGLAGRSGLFQLGQPGDGVFARVAAHILGRLQAAAECWPFGLAENAAALVVIELYAAHAGRFAIRHTRYRAGNRGRDAARAAVVTTVHGRCAAAGRRRCGIFIGAVFYAALAPASQSRMRATTHAPSSSGKSWPAVGWSSSGACQACASCSLQRGSTS